MTAIRSPRLIDLLLLPNMLGTSSTLSSEMLVAAENAAIGRRLKPRRLHIRTVAVTADPVVTPAGLKLYPDFSLTERAAKTRSPAQIFTPGTQIFTPGNYVFIPALWRNPKPALLQHRGLRDYLVQANNQGSTIAAVGSGCFILAATGLLTNKPATTHWHYFDQFARQYPKVKLKRDYFITQANNLYCAASVNSFADLIVHFIQELYNKSVAQHVQRHFSHEIRRAYESMRYYEGGSDQHSDESILQTQLWLQDHYAQAVNIHQLATQFGMSVRNFNRRFKHATGKTPLKYLQEVRMGNARDLLQTSNLSISEIALQVGYHDLGHFSILFRDHFDATPMNYRAMVRAKLFNLRL